MTGTINSSKDAFYETQEDEPDLYGIFGADLDKYFTHFPKYTYNSILLIIYGQFENWLRRFCEADHVKKLSPIKVTDFGGNNYIEKSKAYFEKIAGIDFKPIKSDWGKISEIQKLRNAIAHNNSNIIVDKDKELNRQSLYQVVKRNSEITLDEHSGDFFIKSEEFLLEVINLIVGPLKFILDELDKLRVVAKTIHMPGDSGQLFQGKTESILKSIVNSLDILDKSLTGSDAEKIKMDLLRDQLKALAIEGTCVYAFFTGGEWNEKDADYIIGQRGDGLLKLKNLYQAGQDLFY